MQEKPLRELVAHRDWVLKSVYSDRASGAMERRLGLDDLMRDARRGEFDVVVVWRFDCFARSVKQFLLALEEFRSLGIDFVSHQEALDTSTPVGKAMFTIIGAMAELERSVIRERVKAGVDSARRYGTKSGRPIGRPRLIFDRPMAVQLRARGRSWGQIANRLNASAASVRRALQAATQEEVAKATGCRRKLCQEALKLVLNHLPRSAEDSIPVRSTWESDQRVVGSRGNPAWIASRLSILSARPA